MEIVIDADLCTGHGRCNAMAPALYPLDELGFSSLRGQEPSPVPSGEEDDASRGAAECPEGAIQIVD